jgi:AcrR family transcriptional regulator
MERMSENPRVRRSRDRVLTTTFALIAEHGVNGVSVDEVARRSGVAKTTIYRHWPTREALLLDAVAGTSTALEVPDTGTLQGDLRELAATLGRLLQTAGWAPMVPSLVDIAERDTAFAKVHGEMQRGHADALRSAIHRGIERGELPEDADADAIVAGVFGPLYYRRWFSREPIDAAFVETIVRAALAGQTT